MHTSLSSFSIWPIGRAGSGGSKKTTTKSLLMKKINEKKWYIYNIYMIYIYIDVFVGIQFTAYSLCHSPYCPLPTCRFVKRSTLQTSLKSMTMKKTIRSTIVGMLMLGDAGRGRWRLKKMRGTGSERRRKLSR